MTGSVNNSTPLLIGDEVNSVPTNWNGSIDEVKIYNYALTPNEILTEFNRGSAAVFGSVSDNSSYQINAENQKYCVPGDTTSCAAPVAEWSFDAGSGSTVVDSSGNSNTGTWNGTGSHWTSGKFGKAGKFNGSDDYVDLSNNISVKNQSLRTISGWIYINSLPGNTPIFSETINGSNSQRLGLTVRSDGSIDLGGRDTDGGSFTYFAQTSAS